MEKGETMDAREKEELKRAEAFEAEEEEEDDEDEMPPKQKFIQICIST